MAKQNIPMEIEEIYNTSISQIHEPSLRVDFKGGCCSLNKAALELLNIEPGDRASIVKFKRIGEYLICNSGDSGKAILRSKSSGRFYASDWKEVFFKKYPIDKTKGKSIICKIDPDPVVDIITDGGEKLECHYYKIILP